jgi:CRISPR-associated endonuclease Csn1
LKPLWRDKKNREEKARARGKELSAAGTHEEEESIFHAAISHTQDLMREANARTLGEFLYGRSKKRGDAGIRADRKMYEDEFNLLWDTQTKHHPSVLKGDLKAQIHRIIFFQRPLKKQKFLVGPCSFELHRKRTARATLEAQRFRILQDVNRIEITDKKTGEVRRLKNDERELLITALTQRTGRHFGPKLDKLVREALNTAGKMTWGKIRKLLDLPKEDYDINLDQDDKKDLIGDRTTQAMRRALGDKWDELADLEKLALLTDLLTIDRVDSLIQRCLTFWKFSHEEAYKVATTELEPGYASISMKVIKKVLPFLEKGAPWHEALAAAGYRAEKSGSNASMPYLDQPPNLRNPVVMKALHEVKKVVNGLIKRWGKPDLIRIELAREVKLSPRQLAELEKNQGKNKKSNDSAVEEMAVWAKERPEYGTPMQPKSKDLIHYRLWLEQGKACIYSGDTISPTMLFNGTVEVDHVLPLSQSLEDGYMNKVLCLRSENQKKGQRTPRAWLEKSEPEKWRGLIERAKALPYGKRIKFDVDEVKVDDFISKQLTDTQYIARSSKDYLARLGVPVETTKGPVTARLRDLWDINHFLAEDGGVEKNRADHRHHALDALVVAMTNRAVMKNLSVSYERYERMRNWRRSVILDMPWPTFREDVQKHLDSLVVSHAPNRKIWGALTKDTAYGFNKDIKAFVSRVPLHKLEEKHIRQAPGKGRWIVDDAVRSLLIRWMDEGHQLREAESNPPLHCDGKTPIKKVRIAERMDAEKMAGISDKGGDPYKFYATGSNHHVEIIEDTASGKRFGKFITMLEAAKRVRPARGQKPRPLIQKDHGPNFRFIMSLCGNDMVEVEEEGIKKYYRIQKMSGKQIFIRLHTAAILDKKEEGSGPTIGSFNGKKIAVDPLGFFVYAHD